MPPKATKGKKGKKGGNEPKKAVISPQKRKAVEESDDSSDDDDDSDDEPVTKVPQQSPKKAKVAAPADESSDDDSEDSDEDEPVPKVTPKGKKAPPAGDDDDEEDDDDEDDEDDDDDDASDDEAAKPPVKQTKKPAPVAMEADEDEDSEEDDEEEDDDDEDDEEEDSEEDSDEEEKPQVNGKRKQAKQKEKEGKKQKIEEETVALYVGNVPKEMDAAKLRKLFEKKGIVVKDARKNQFKRFGYVDLENKEDLEKALKLNGKKIGDDELKIERAKSRINDGTPNKSRERDSNVRDDQDTTLFVKNLSDDTTEDDLKDFFPGCVGIRLPKKADSSSHRGFAYIVYKEVSEVEKALKEKQGSELDGNALFLDKAGGAPKRKFDGGGDGGSAKSNVLFVRNLSFDTDEEGLKNAFEGAKEARIAKFPDTQKPKGFGFVEFDTAEQAQEALKAVKSGGKELDGRNIFVDFAGEKGRGGGGGRGGRGGFRGGRGGGGRGGGFRGGRGGGGRGGFRGGRGGGDRGGFKGKRGGGGFPEGQNKKKKFDD